MIHLPDHFRFADPVWLWGIPLGILLLLLGFFLSRSRHSTLALGNPRLVALSPRFLTPDLLPWLLRLLALVLCLLGAARPQMGQKKVQEKAPVTDLFVDLDVSGSMITTDLKPNRITAAKQFLADFLDKVQGVRMGLTIFARFSFTQCPLTTDVQVVKQLLANVEPAPHSIKWDGTAMGDSLVSCLNRLKNGTPAKGGPDQPKETLLSKWLGSKEDPEDEDNGVPNRAIVLLTDGSNNCGAVDPIAAAKIAATQGVRVYAVGMGSNKSIPALYEYPDGHMGYVIDRRTNQIAMSEPADMNLLKQVASITGGKAYAATDNRAFQRVLDEIAQLEKREVTVTSHWEYNELASYFLLSAFALLALELLLGTTLLRTLP
ncbi:MAG TPA: VWA domain-containing protein [bacterium]|nr:VWA domain-containing protein [bacterium]